MGFLVVLIFLERHFDSLKYLGIVFLTIPLANITCFAFVLSWVIGGFSCVKYFLYANLLLILIFNYKDYFIGKFKWIFPLIILLLVVITMSWIWSGKGMDDVGMVLFNGFKSLGHSGLFITRIIVGIFSRIFAF